MAGLPEADELEGAESPESLSPVANDERTYGRYLLQYEIASGGMASVYLARALGAAGFERPIAIKRIHPHLAKKPVFVDMFLDEARLNARIAHPNVCSVFDFGEADGTFFMAMEYLVGQPLSRVLGAVSLRPELATSTRWHALAARILADACQGLHAAHELVDDHGEPLHVVHRDFTPHNVFVTYDGAVKVFDFGVARAEGRLHQTETGMLKGKLAYMSPEQLARAPIDRRLDVWAAGVCLWELLTLRRLFGKRSEIEIVQAIGSEPILKPSQVRAGVPAELDAITMRALERDPDRRTNSARILARELNQYLSTTGESTSLHDVAELMTELFPEERARKLDVVANVLRSEDGIPIDDSSAVQRARSSAGSVAAPRRTFSPRMPTPTPSGTRAPSLRPGPVSAERRDPTGGVRTAAPLTPARTPVLEEEEATTQSTVDLADMLEPPSEVSVSLQLPPGATSSSASMPPIGTRRAWMVGAIVTLALLGIGVFAIVVSGGLDAPAGPETSPPATPPPTVVTSTAPTDEARGHGSGEAPEATRPTSGSGSSASTAASATGEVSPDTIETEPDTQLSEPGALATSETSEASAETSETSAETSETSPETEAAPRPRTRGSINVAARGGWADLLVDGRPVGRTPRSVSLPEGRHVVELRPPGGAAIRRAVTVRAGRTQRLLFDL